MVSRSFQETVVWNSIKHIDLTCATPFVQEDRPAISRSLYRRVLKLVNVESFSYEKHPDLEVTHLLLEAIGGRLKRIHIRDLKHVNDDMKQAILKSLSPETLEYAHIPSAVPFLKQHAKWPHLHTLGEQVDFADIGENLSRLPALRLLTIKTPLSDGQGEILENWNATISLLRTQPNFARLYADAPANFVHALLGNPDQGYLTPEVINYVKTKLDPTSLPLIKICYNDVIETLAGWVLGSWIREPSENTYSKMYELCCPGEPVEARFERLKWMTLSRRVPVRSREARKALAVYLDDLATTSLPKDFNDPHLTVMLISALDSALLVDRAAHFWAKYGRKAYEDEKKAGKTLEQMCQPDNENDAWAGYIAHGLKDEEWCRSSGFLQEVVTIMRESNLIRGNHYNIRPGLFALMMNYDAEFMPLFIEMFPKAFSNTHSGYLGRMIAEYDVAIDIPPISKHIAKIVEIMRLMKDAPEKDPSNKFWFRLTDLSTEEHKWTLGLLGYFPGESPLFQEARLLLMELCQNSLNYFSMANAETWLAAPDEVTLEPLKELVKTSKAHYTGQYQEPKRFEESIWNAVFSLIAKGGDPVRLVKRALQFGMPPEYISDPQTHNMDSISLMSMNNLAAGYVSDKYSVWDKEVLLKMQRGLHANLKK